MPHHAPGPVQVALRLLLVAVVLVVPVVEGQRGQANVPTAARNVARGAARGATDALVTSVTQSNSEGPINYGGDSSQQAKQVAAAVAIGAANGAVEAVSSSNSGGGSSSSSSSRGGGDGGGGGVSVSQQRARSDSSLSTYDKLFSVVLSRSNMTDSQKAAASRMAKGTLSVLNASVEFNCAWQVSVDAKTFNVAFPDGNAVYNVLMVPKLSGPFDVVRIQGQFPMVRYFSYQSYDPDSLEPVASLRDYEVKPLTGTNPFASPSSSNSRGTYQVHVTLRGDQGYPNELPTVSPGSNATGAFVLLRLYAFDPSSPNRTSLWGAVPPPSVSYKIFQQQSSVPSGDGGVWWSLEQCSDNNTRDAAKALNAMVTAYRVTQSGEKQQGDDTCAAYNQENNFRLFKRTGSRAPFLNKDAAYILACGSSKGLQGNLVAVVRGSLPPSPMGLWAPPLVSDPSKYNARYVSLSVYDLQLPGPVLQTAFDWDMGQFYAKAWQQPNSKRRYTVVVAESRAVAQRCRLLGSDAMLLVASPPTSTPGLVLREILAQSQRFEKQPSKLSSSSSSIHAVSEGCAVQGQAACTRASYARSVMGPDYYPTVTWYDCQRDGTVRPAPFNASVTA